MMLLEYEVEYAIWG